MEVPYNLGMADDQFKIERSYQPDEYELTAAIAAVSAFIAGEETSVAETEPAGVSAWPAASRLEGVSRGAARLCRPLPAGARRNPWAALVLPFLPVWLAIGLFLLASGVPSVAQAENAASAARDSGSVLVRIGLRTAVQKVAVDIPDGAELQDAATGKLLKHLPAGGKIAFSLDPRSYLLKPSGGDGLFGIDGKLYRGMLLVRGSQAAPGALNAINILDLEDYLLSVVPSEMPSGWPLEALKAQSVAARSYAVSNIGKYESEGFDLKATTEDQLYVGVSAESPLTNRAVAETAGIVLKHQGQVVPAFFHSTSGGYTQMPDPISGKSYPFLKAVPDYDDKSPYFTWSQQFSVPVIEEALHKCGRDVGSLLAVYVVSRAPSLRARHVLFVGSDGIRLVSGDELRRMLSLPSTNFNVGCADKAYVIAGRGFGHGVGLSQWGARALAENGYNAAQILTYYYRDVSLDYFRGL